MIDLHSHSTGSDGSLSPTELAKEAASRGIKTLALTDHDTTIGLEEAKAEAALHGLRILPGLEVTCHVIGSEIHMLGLGVNPETAVLKELCAQIGKSREERFKSMVEKLRQIGVPLKEMETPKVGALCRPTVARMLVEQGHAISMNDAFAKYLRKGRPAFVPHKEVPAQRAINVIHEAGGLAFVAHAGNYSNGDDVINELRQHDLDGIEVWHPDHGHNKIDHFKSKANKLDLLMSGGADFHHLDHPRAKYFGKRGCPEEQFERIEDALAAMK
ncbi:PHP domain-containing protein [Planctomycetota bacterium]|nr:PHP domain-containing protein [Planctomycetota bacterium]